MNVPVLSPYFRWLQKGNPTGEVERYPDISEQGETSLSGVFVVGDLTGIPLLKLAADGGSKQVKQILAQADFKKQRPKLPDEVYEILIIGGGPAGVAAALECQQQGLRYLLLESSGLFQTLENFPTGKPIFAKPDGYEQVGPLLIEDGHKESLLASLKNRIAGEPLRVRNGVRVNRLTRKDGYVVAESTQGTFSALRVILAIGKSGDARKLNIPGENLPHVYNRLFDPGDFVGQKILVVGGGDSAVEAAIALAEMGNRVTLSYRKAALERAKPENQERFNVWVAKGMIEPRYGTVTQEIRIGEVTLAPTHGQTGAGKGQPLGQKQTVDADHVFVLIGRELPVAFFKRSGIRLAGDKDFSTTIFLTAMLSFFSMLYFGKAGVDRNVFTGAESFFAKVTAYLTAPLHIGLDFSLPHYAWYGSLAFLLGWFGSVVFLASGALALGTMVKRRKKYFARGWPLLKYSYFIALAIAYTVVYFKSILMRNAGWAEEPVYWYSLFYSISIILFGIRRVLVRKTRYIRYQMLSLALVQAVFLFWLPFYGFESLIQPHFEAHSWVMREMFPAGKWSCFGFVLFWPLNMNDFGTSTFWTWFPLVQTFGVLFAIVKLWGKGAYCGWICSCGGLAESLGDEYRTQAPHGKTPKNLDNIGQFVLAFAILVTVVGYFVSHRLPAIGAVAGATHPGFAALPLVADTLRGVYKLSIDVLFAGVLGLGFYFFFGGRVWCRFGCPLAALMHLYSRFSVYRIFAEKKKCISCNICTKVCHMGIDVMGYANKGIPLNDVECVRCSACVQSCPTETLSFGALLKTDTDNISRNEVPRYGKEDWRAGIH